MLMTFVAMSLWRTWLLSVCSLELGCIGSRQDH